MLEQFRAVAGIFHHDQACLPQYLNGPIGDIPQVANGCGDDIQNAWLRSRLSRFRHGIPSLWLEARRVNVHPVVSANICYYTMDYFARLR
jgi:hypothetical protein